jgi:thymidylate synthase (FAD)
MNDEQAKASATELVTQSSVEYIDHMGNDLSIERAARVSFAGDNEVRPPEKTERLLKYLAKHKHWTPFAHTAITLRIQAPIPIRTQCFKHKVGFTENEESRRYVAYTPSVFLPEWREVTKNKKQGSGSILNYIDSHVASNTYRDSVDKAVAAYEELLKLGVCEEQARFILPQGVMVNWYWTGSLAAWARFCHQRLDPHAQKEIQDLASKVDSIIEPLFPVAWKALMDKE